VHAVRHQKPRRPWCSRRRRETPGRSRPTRRHTSPLVSPWVRAYERRRRSATAAVHRQRQPGEDVPQGGGVGRGVASTPAWCWRPLVDRPLDGKRASARPRRRR
jgi:hypothetical protein